VYTISREDSADKLISIISGSNAQMAFDKVLSRQIRTELINIEKVLSVTKKKIYLDTFDLDVEINSYTRLEKQLAETFENKRNEAAEELDSTVQEVVDQIRGALISNSESIAEAMLSGNQTAAEAIIIETIRPIMLANMKDISVRQVDSVAKALDFTGVVSESDEIDLTDVAVNLAGNIKNFIEQGAFNKKNEEDADKNNTNKKGKSKKETVKNIYHIAAGIAAIATDVIAPWLEVVIILLPDIVSLLNGLLGESSTEVAKHRFENNVVPQIIRNSYPEVRRSVETTTKLVLDEYEKMLNEKIEAIKANLAEAQNKKNQKTEEFENYRVTVSEDIETVKRLINELGVR
jgi:F0F1-type ATP synthase membrane subunit b/b'